MKVRLFPATWILGVLVASLLGACSGGGSGGGGVLTLASSNVEDTIGVRLNQVIEFRFTAPVDIRTVSFETITFFNLTSSSPVTGSFRLSPADDRIVQFVPTLPTNETFSNGGLLPGEQYEVRIARMPSAITVQSKAGRRVSEARTIRFTTVEIGASTPLSDIFQDLIPGRGPAPLRTDPVSGTQDLALNKFSDPSPVTFTIVFDQPLFPAETNINSETIFLWDLDRARRVPAQPALVRNDIERTEVVLSPLGLLPADTRIEVRYSNGLIDIVGEGNNAVGGFVVAAGDLKTRKPTPGSEPDTIPESFDDLARFDEAAVSTALQDPNDFATQGEFTREGVWEAGQGGFVQARRPFPGDNLLGDLVISRGFEINLNTDSQLIVDKTGNVVNVRGGVFQFENILIEPSVSTQDRTILKGKGSNPLVLLATGRVRIDGILDVDGGQGTHNVLQPQFGGFRAAGGIAGPAGGTGGDGSPMDSRASGIQSVDGGEDGFGPRQTPGGGGQGGESTPVGVNRNQSGGGGGGGSFLQVGVKGVDGSRGNGGQPGPPIFTDLDPNNNFFGLAGEFPLAALHGGEGGGGGGDRLDNNASKDDGGAGGGGGGGAVYVASLGEITLSSTGLITAKGGDGGGGATNACSDVGGGGGGGSGGLVILHSSEKVRVHGTIDVQGGVPTKTNCQGTQRLGGPGGHGLVQVESSEIDSTDLTVKPGTQALFTRGFAPFGARSMVQSNFYFLGESDIRGGPFFDEQVSGEPLFKGTDPLTGEVTDLQGASVAIDTVIPASGGSEQVLQNQIPANAKVFIYFQGADELDRDQGTGLPDLNTLTPWTPDLRELQGKRFIRYRVLFDIAADGTPLQVNTPFPRVVAADVPLRF